MFIYNRCILSFLYIYKWRIHNISTYTGSVYAKQMSLYIFCIYIDENVLTEYQYPARSSSDYTTNTAKATEELWERDGRAASSWCGGHRTGNTEPE